jgi:hypothetical protein
MGGEERMCKKGAKIAICVINELWESLNTFFIIAGNLNLWFFITKIYNTKKYN